MFYSYTRVVVLTELDLYLNRIFTQLYTCAYLQSIISLYNLQVEIGVIIYIDNYIIVVSYNI